MLEFAQALLFATTILTALSFVGYILAIFAARSAQPVHVAATTGVAATTSQVANEDAAAKKIDISWYASKIAWLALAALTLSVIMRMIATRKPPMANHYEFAVMFCWGMLLFHIIFEWKYKVRTLALAVLPVICGMLVYATTLSYQATPLMPALQNSPLLTLHVFTAALSYGAAVVSFGAGVMYLLTPKVSWKGWPKQDVLDDLGYKAVVVTFPLLTISIILGSIWANVAWGRYWSWDPKEVAALVTWFIYGAYLHARVVRDWRGSKAAWLLVLGFLAIIFTYLGNLFFGGMHSYA